MKRASEKHFCAVNIWNQVVTPGDAEIVIVIVIDDIIVIATAIVIVIVP